MPYQHMINTFQQNAIFLWVLTQHPLNFYGKFISILLEAIAKSLGYTNKKRLEEKAWREFHIDKEKWSKVGEHWMYIKM